MTAVELLNIILGGTRHLLCGATEPHGHIGLVHTRVHTHGAAWEKMATGRTTELRAGKDIR